MQKIKLKMLDFRYHINKDLCILKDIDHIRFYMENKQAIIKRAHFQFRTNSWFQEHITFLLCEYRQLSKTKKYDRIVSW